MPHPELNENIKYTFHRAFRWNFFGSMFYECIKMFHNLGLLYAIDASMYGLIGSTFSLIYCATKIADGGGTQTLPAFFNLIIKSRNNFYKTLLNYFLLPIIPLIFTTTVISLIFYTRYLQPSWYLLNLPLIAAIAAIIILETIRTFLRYLLHFSFKSKSVVLLETIFFTLYVTLLWGGFYGNFWPLTLQTMLIAHLIESTIAVITLIILTGRMYHQLPPTTLSTPLDSLTHKRFWHARAFNYLLRLSRELFSSNFMTPLFAYKFGLQATGLFYVAGVLVTSIQSIIKLSIGYSGNALLAHIKNDSHAAKKQAFVILSEKTFKMLLPLIIIGGLNSGHVIKIYQQATYNFGTIISLCALLFIIIASEFFVILYEQFYMVEEAAQKLLFIKLGEYVFYYLSVVQYSSSSLLETLLRIAIVRITSLCFMGYNAYSTWLIIPSFKTQRSYIIKCFILGICVFVLLAALTHPHFHLTANLL